MKGKICKIAGETFYILQGFEETANEYFYINYNSDHPLVITEGTFDIPSSAIQVAEGLWKKVA